MRAIVPYAVLGLIGVAGIFAAATHRSTGPVVVVDHGGDFSGDGAVRVSASLDRTVLPAGGGDAFLRVALEGAAVNEKVKRDRAPVSLTLVIDRSGSMGTGRKMDDAKAAAIAAIKSLTCGDRVSVVSFDDGAESHGNATVLCMNNPLTGTEPLVAAVEQLTARGGTDMVSGLRTGGEAATSIFGDDRVNRLLLLSDGRPDTENGLKEQVQSLAQRGITTTTLGLGEDYNEDLMSGLADAGLGHYYFVEKPEQLAGIFAGELQSLANVVARKTSVQITPAAGTRIVDVIGFRFDRSGDSVVIPAGDVYAGRVTDILLRLHTDAAEGQRDVAAVHVEYQDVSKGANAAVDKKLAALFSTDRAKVDASSVADVAVKAEKWRAAQALVDANAAYDRGDNGAGDKILGAATARLNQLADQYNAPELKSEAQANEQFKAQNDAGGAAWRGVGTKAAKKRAWSMNKGSAYRD